MSEEQDLSTLAYTANVFEEYLSNLVARETLLARLLSEHKAALEAIQSMPEDGEAECMLPIGGGVSIPVRVRGGANFLVALGAGVYLKKNKTDTIYYLNKRIEELEKALRVTLEQKRQVEEQLAQVRRKLQQALQSRQQ